MPDYVNAVAAVLVSFDSEGFGLAALEALACRVPVLSTPVGIAPVALGRLVAPFDPETWTAAARAQLERDDPRVNPGRVPSLFSAQRMAERVIAAYRGVIGVAGSRASRPGPANAG